MRKRTPIRAFGALLTIITFFTSNFQPLAKAQEIHLPVPGVMLHLSPDFIPAHLVGITVHPEDSLQFDFLINQGDKQLADEQKSIEYKKLIKYFLASLTIPDEDQWVNLSPYEKDRIIKDNFGKTEMGRDLLAQDYILKQITSSLIYPEESLGKKFWDKVYERAWKEFGTTNIPVNTFNKVWIIPDQALVYESGNTAYVLKNHLKVMLEEDYLSLAKHTGITSAPILTTAKKNNTHTIGSQVIREIILPELENEVNTGKNFANLRQIYSSMILAAWYKHALKESLLGMIYANRDKVRGVDQQNPQVNEMIYRQYLKAFKKGVFNYIKEDMDKYTNEIIPRKYFSGGTVAFRNGAQDYNGAITDGTVEIIKDKIPSEIIPIIDQNIVDTTGIDNVDVKLGVSKSPAMTSSLRKMTMLAAIAIPTLILTPIIATAHAQSPEYTALYQSNQTMRNRNITVEQAHQELKVNLDAMLQVVKNKYGDLVPDIVRAPHIKEITANATTYDEFTTAVKNAFQPKEALYESGKMTPDELNEYVNLQNEFIRWTYFFWRTNVKFDISGWAKRAENISDFFNPIVGNPQSPADADSVNHLGSNGHPRTWVCSVSVAEELALLHDSGYGNEKSASAVKVDTNFNGRNEDAPTAGGHVAVLIKTADGKARLFDLTETADGPWSAKNGLTPDSDNLSIVDRGTPHLQISGFNDTTGELTRVHVRNNKGLVGITGYTFNQINDDARSRALILQSEKDLDKITTEANQTTFAIYNKKNYIKAYSTYSTLISSINNKISLLQNSNLSNNVSDWTAPDLFLNDKPISGAVIISAYQNEKDYVQGMQSNASIGIGINNINTLRSSWYAANGLFNSKQYKSASSAYAVLISKINTELQRLTDQGTDKIPTSTILWKDGAAKPIDSTWLRNQLLAMQTSAQQLKAKSDQLSSNHAMVNINNMPTNNKYGGIDLNSANLNLQIKRNGKGVPLPINMQDLRQLKNIPGFVPEIIKITPAVNLPILNELQQRLESTTT